ncbi:MAG: hypothetical protein SGJ01_01975 [Gemmatimonadota bacterium]|nr:hypothetical protein [Gemmatimonadota bacterium]
MSDLPESGYRTAVAGLDQQRSVYRRLAALTDAERAVLNADDLTILADLAGAGDDMLPELAVGAAAVRAGTTLLRQATGPRATALRALIERTAVDGRATSTALLRLLREVRSRRDMVGQELQELDPEEPVTLVDRRG